MKPSLPLRASLSPNLPRVVGTKEGKRAGDIRFQWSTGDTAKSQTDPCATLTGLREEQLWLRVWHVKALCPQLLIITNKSRPAAIAMRAHRSENAGF